MTKTKKDKAKPKKDISYVPDESGHMVEWVGDHPIGVVSTEEEETKYLGG